VRFRWLVSVLSASAVVVALLALTPAPSTAATCPLCTNFVTTYDPDGTGPAAPVTRLHRNLLVDVPYALDVDGTLKPLLLGLPLPGYEVSVTVLAVNPDKPTVVISRLGSSTTPLPLRIELVQGDPSNLSSEKTAVGYDTLGSTMPKTFRAVVDLSDRDGDPDTTDALATVTITSPPSSMTLLEEQFTGDPVATRTDRHVRRLTFSGDGTTTHVPTAIGLDLTASSTHQHVLLTHNLVTDGSFELTEPDGTTTTGSLSALPASVDVTADLTDARTAFVYHASSRTAQAVITNQTPDRTFTADIANLPATIGELSVTNAPGGGVFKLDSDARADSAKLTVDQDGKHAVATLTAPPRAVTVDYGSQSGVGHVHYSTSGELIDHANLVANDALGENLTLDVDAIPSTLDVDYATTQTTGANADDDLKVTYAASSPIPHAQLQASGLVGFLDRATRMDVTLDDIPTQVAVDIDKAKVTTDQAPTPLPPPERCSHEPNPEDDKYCPQYSGPGDQVILYKRVSDVRETTTVSATTPDAGRLGHGQVLITSGPDDELEAANEIGTPVDGVLYEDTADKFVVSGRISEFDALTAKQSDVTRTTRTDQVSGDDEVSSQQIESETAAALDTNAPSHSLELTLRTQPHDGSLPVDQTLMRLATLPTHLELDTSSKAIAGHDVTTWSASDVVDGYDTATIDGQHRPGFFMGNGTIDGNGIFTHKKTVQIDPMPKNFTACQASADDSCADGVFDANLAKGHVGPTDAETAAACAQFGHLACMVPAPWFYRTWACLGPETCSQWKFPSQPGDANQGTVRLQADSPVSLFYGTNDYLHLNAPFTTLSFQDLTRFVLQGHHVTEIGGDCDGCEYGEVALDTDGHPITGQIEQAEGSTGAFFNFPAGFSASHLVWDFKKTGSLSGRLATLGALTCPSGTKIEVGGDDHTGQICHGDLT
jgi:hypothetical protein